MPKAQQGAAVVIVTIGMAAIIAMAGLALDGGHMIVNKSRLQNAVDAAALSAAKTLIQTSRDTIASRAAAVNTFTLNANSAGNGELGDALTLAGTGWVETQFSDTLEPFNPGSVDPNFVRVTIQNFQSTTYLLQILGVFGGGANKSVSASAVAGIGPTTGSSGTTCDLTPMMVCGNEDTDPNDDDYYGYEINELQVLKTGGGDDSAVGPGNFQLVRLGDNSGAADLRDAMAGGFEECFSVEDDIDTEPGNTVGPTVQGLNTRFNEFGGPIKEGDYPPDFVIDEVEPGLSLNDDGDIVDGAGAPIESDDITDWGFDQYSSQTADCVLDPSDSACEPGGVEQRRVLAVPIGDCSSTTNGSGTVPMYGVGCFYIMQKVIQQGTEAQVYGQFVDECEVKGFATEPDDSEGSVPIWLFKDPGRDDA